MNFLPENPLVRTILGIAAIAVLSLALPMYWPLPVPEGSLSEDLSAAEIADYLNFEPVVAETSVARPLFHANRRPPVKVAQLPTPKAPERKPTFSFELVGIMGSEAASRTVFLFHTGTKETLTGRAGQVLDGWYIETINSDSVVLSGDQGTKTLSIGSGG